MYGATLTVLGDDVVDALVVEEVVELDYVGVVEALQQVHLVYEVYLSGLGHHLLLHTLYCTNLTCLFLYPTVDITKTTLTDFFLNLIEVKDILISDVDKAAHIDLNILILGGCAHLKFFLTHLIALLSVGKS